MASLSLIPNLSSPKLPHPIFFPTLKLGPTISTELWLELISRELRDETWGGLLESLRPPFPRLLVRAAIAPSMAQVSG